MTNALQEGNCQISDRIADEFGVVTQVAVEESMACGVGVCMTCVLPIIDDDGLSKMIRSCVAGPVFDAARVRFDDINTLPPDIYGADGMAGH